MGEYQRKVESGRVPEKGPGEYRERWDPSEYQKKKIEIWARTREGKGRIRASIGEGKIRVSTEKGRIRASTGNGGFGRVPGKVGSEQVSEKVKSG